MVCDLASLPKKEGFTQKYTYSHIAYRRHASTANSAHPRAKIFNDKARPSPYGQETRQLHDNVFRGGPTAQLPFQFYTQNSGSFQFPRRTVANFRVSVAFLGELPEN